MIRATLAATGVTLAFALLGCSQSPKQIPPPALPNGPTHGKIGDALSLPGSASQGQMRMRVRVLRVLDPAPVGPADVTLSASARFVGVELSLTNIGHARYAESPLADAALLTDNGGKANPEQVLGGPCGGQFASHVAVAPGGTRSGCVAFEVPAGRRPAQFRFALDAGFAPQAGTWRLK